jgi:hypothetical protein
MNGIVMATWVAIVFKRRPLTNLYNLVRKRAPRIGRERSITLRGRSMKPPKSD